MELLQGIESRRTCRGFKPMPVPGEILEKILQAAARSPSYTNSQPWEVAVVTGRKRDELSRLLLERAKSGAPTQPDIKAPESWPPALEARSREHNARRFQALGIERADDVKRKAMRLRNYDFYGAPCAIFLYIERSLTTWSVFDSGLFAQTLILAAHSFGLATCLQGSTVWYPDILRNFLGIPENKMLVLGISLGYPDPTAPLNAYESSRAPLSEFVRWYA